MPPVVTPTGDSRILTRVVESEQSPELQEEWVAWLHLCLPPPLDSTSPASHMAVSSQDSWKRLQILQWTPAGLFCVLHGQVPGRVPGRFPQESKEGPKSRTFFSRKSFAGFRHTKKARPNPSFNVPVPATSSYLWRRGDSSSCAPFWQLLCHTVWGMSLTPHPHLPLHATAPALLPALLSALQPAPAMCV